MKRTARWISFLIIIFALTASVTFNRNAVSPTAQWQRSCVTQLKGNAAVITELFNQSEPYPDPSSMGFEGIIRIEECADLEGIYLIYKDGFLSKTGFLLTCTPVTTVPIDAGITVEVIDKCDSFYIYRLTLHWD